MRKRHTMFEIKNQMKTKCIFFFIALVLAFGRRQPAAVSTRTELSGTVTKQLVAAMLRHAAETKLNVYRSASGRSCDWRKEIHAGVIEIGLKQEDPVSIWLIGQREKLRIDFLHWRSAEDWQQLGIAGFEALETNAAPAVAELTSF